MWNRKQSIKLSKVFTMLFAVGLVLLIGAAPWVVKWLIYYSVNVHSNHYYLLLVTIYSGGVAAGLLIFNLFLLLKNIEKEQIFVQTNTAYLRNISWCCFLGGFISLLSGIYYMPWWIVTVAAAFMGLIVRVVKNILAEAISLKEENDFTI